MDYDTRTSRLGFRLSLCWVLKLRFGQVWLKYWKIWLKWSDFDQNNANLLMKFIHIYRILGVWLAWLNCDKNSWHFIENTLNQNIQSCPFLPIVSTLSLNDLLFFCPCWTAKKRKEKWASDPSLVCPVSELVQSIVERQRTCVDNHSYLDVRFNIFWRRLDEPLNYSDGVWLVLNANRRCLNWMAELSTESNMCWSMYQT